jgi:hypothetical protein
LGEIAVHTLEGLRWAFSSVNGENRSEARGATKAQVWQRACEQVRTLGMLGECRPAEDAHADQATPKHEIRCPLCGTPT